MESLGQGGLCSGLGKGSLLQGLGITEWQLGNKSVFLSSMVLSKRVCELRTHHLTVL